MKFFFINDAHLIFEHKCGWSRSNKFLLCFLSQLIFMFVILFELLIKCVMIHRLLEGSSIINEAFFPKGFFQLIVFSNIIVQYSSYSDQKLQTLPNVLQLLLLTYKLHKHIFYRWIVFRKSNEKARLCDYVGSVAR